MKNLSIFSLALASLIAGYVVEAHAQCAAQPSCSDLGYSYSGSTTDCVNTPMKCPFDTTYFNCVKKADAISLLMPNYVNRVTQSCNTSYTASSNGYLFGHLEHNGDYQHGGFYIYINGINVRLTSSGTDYGEDVFLFPVKKGASYRVVYGTSGKCGIAFVPLN